MNQDQPNPKRSLSEISHLFLSSVRDRQTGGTARPVRTPPTAKRDVTIDLSPEEFAQVFEEAADELVGDAGVPVTAIIGTHLNGSLNERVREYARHLSASGTRVGLIECDAFEFCLSLFEQNPNPAAPAEAQDNPSAFDARKMREALEELSCDVDRWLLLFPNPRSHEARTLLREVDHWVLLSTCDHDGVVAGYRTLKGMSDLHRPRISLALLAAASKAEADKVFRKLASVTNQFLNWPLESESPVQNRNDIAEHSVLHCRATQDKAQLATAPQWQILADFLARNRSALPAQSEVPMATATAAPLKAPKPAQVVADVVIPERDAVRPVMNDSFQPKISSEPDLQPTEEETDCNVIDLPNGAATPAAIISAVMRGSHQQFVECPVKPPMCPEASLAVGRDHRLTLLAVARQGLSDLRAIGRAYQWLMENRALITMAVPQFAIDAHQLPRLQLLIDQADLSADILQPMLQSSNVTVLAYRKLRWAGRTGLLLNAA